MTGRSLSDVQATAVDPNRAVERPRPPRPPRPEGRTFVEQITSQALWHRYDELFDARDDIRVIDRMLGRPRVLEWVHSVGVASDPALRSLVPPIPPNVLRQITAEPELAVFLWTGLVEVKHILELYARHGRRPGSEPLRILDFGCGCGRLARFLRMRPDRAPTHGCDVNPAHVLWCSRNLEGFETTPVGPLPPTPYGNGSFDLVYALSVFTHLSQEATHKWLAELWRVLAPGGVLVVTTHGPTALETIRVSPFHQQMFALQREVIEEVLRDLDQAPFRFFKYAPETLGVTSAGDDYGSTFINPKYIREHWTERFDMLEYLPGGLHGWQDIVVLGRRRREFRLSTRLVKKLLKGQQKALGHLR